MYFRPVYPFSASGPLSSMPKLQIEQQRAEIGIKQTPGQMLIQQPPPQVTMKTEPAQVHIDRELSKLYIDQSRAWAAYALIPPVTATKTIVDKVKEIYPQIVAKIAQDGDRMADIHLSGNVFAELAREWPRQLTEFDIAGPASRLNVDLKFIPEQLEMHVEGGHFYYEVEPQKPRIEHVPARVDIYLRQRPYIKIEWVGQHVDVRG